MRFFKNDEERKKYFCPENGSGHNVQAIYEEALKKGKADTQALTIFDAIKDFWKEKHPDDSIFLYDLRRGLHHYAIGYVNAGADDFNSASNSLCPSIMVCGQFQQTLKGKEEMEKRFADALADKTTPASRDYAVRIAILNDLLYLYKELKNRKGLNYKMIASDSDKVEIEKTMETMDKYLSKPEEKRWVAEEKKVQPSLLKRLFSREK